MWNGKLTRLQAIKLVEVATNHDDPFWSDLVEEFYDEETDTMPSIMDLMHALGVTEEEYKEVSGAQNIEWPNGSQNCTKRGI